MNTNTKNAKIRSALRKRQLRRHYIKLTVKERYPSASAIRLVAEKYGISESTAFRLIRPVDLRAMLNEDWDAAMKLHSLNLAPPKDVEIDPLEAGEL
jgi:hypothetical protein